MKKLIFIAGFLLRCILPYAYAQEAAEHELSGHYYLDTTRELGSELLLRANGSFEWMMSYGATDRYAYGQWKQQGDVMILETSDPKDPPEFRLFEESELNIRKPAKHGTWVAVVGMPRVAPVAYPVEVVFVSDKGHRFTATTNGSGEAIVEAPADEVWLRAGLQTKVSAALQWFDIPKARQADRIAAFAVRDKAWIIHQAFDEMRLKRQGNNLVSEDGRMVYSK